MLNHISKCRQDADGNCTVHGGIFYPDLASCQTTDVLLEVREERASQFLRYGDNSDLELGTGPLVTWLPGVDKDATAIERMFRTEYNRHPKPSWMQLIREEVAEAFMEDDPVRLRAELLQVAALAVSCIEKLDAGHVEG